MTQDKERFSAWLDDANDADGLVYAPDNDEPATLGLAARYRLIGDALRGEIEDNSMSDISAYIREAIESEPACSRPVARVHHLPVTKKARPFDFGSWLRPAGGLALAASVAMVVVVTVTRQDTPATGDGVVAVSAPEPVMAVPVNNQPGPALAARSYATNESPAVPAVNLNEYMEEHSEYASQDIMQRIMPHARAVSYESR